MVEEREKKTETLLLIIIGIILIGLIILGLIYAKSEKGKKSITTTTTTASSESEDKYNLTDELKNKIITKEEDGYVYLYIDNFKVNIESIDGYYNFKLLKDKIIFTVSDKDVFYLYAVDLSGDNEVNLSKGLNGSYSGDYNIKNNIIYVNTNNLGQDPAANVCNAKSNKKVSFVTKITYKNNEFAKKLDSYKTAREYINENSIDCNK